MASIGSSSGLQIGVFFDFDKGKAKGVKDLEDYMMRLQTLADKKKLHITAGVDTGNKTFLANYNKSIDEINRKIKDISKQWKKLEGTNAIWDKDGNVSKQAMLLAQQYRELITLRKNAALTLEELNRRMDKQMAAERKAVQQLSGEYKKQGGYLQHLIQRMTVYASFAAIGGFLTKVREVTAEFELQRISLGAIIQDQNRANALFSEIKNFALQSPLKILDLTKYTKQLAAYRIETDKLFDTTKRLADISVGLGVDMQRIILFYGQVRAAGYLRASEVRQATEAGIPLVEELANKLSQARGELVSVGQVMDMISKRQISFQDVADVFEDLTNKGGIFYNMQEKQGNTLYGMWQKLGDAVQVMYDQIGNTGWVNEGMKGFIGVLRSLMLNWRDVGRAIGVASVAFLAFKANAKYLTLVKSASLLVEQAIEREILAEERLNAAKLQGNKLSIISAEWKLRSAQYSRMAAEANGFLTKSILRSKAAFASLGATLSAFAPMLIVTAITTLIMKLYSLREEANRLKNALDKVKESASVEISKSIQNFESLANAAVKARDGSKEQRDALEELQTTYGKMIPAQDLQIEKLREMKGNYDLLTEAIRNNIAAQKMQEGITTVIENFAPKIKEAEDKIKKTFHAKGWGIEGLGLSNEQTDRIIDNAKRLIKQGKDYRDAWNEAFKMEGMVLREGFWEERGNAAEKAMRGLADTLRDEKRELDAWESSMKSAYNNLGLFAPYIEEAKKNIENATFTSEKGTFEFEQERVNKTVEEYTNAIRKALEYKKSKINLDDFITVDETNPERLMAIDFEGLKKAISDEGGKLNVQVRDLVTVIQGEWAGLVPSDPVVYQVRTNLLKLAEGVDESIRNKLLRSLWDGSAGIDEHLKTLKGQIEQYEADLQRMKNAVKVGGFIGLLNQLRYGKQIEETEKVLELLREQFEFEKKYTITKDKTGGGDTRLQELQEINQTLEKINKEYNEMLKLEGETQATQRLNKDFKDTLDYINKIGKKFGLKFDFPTSFTSLQQYRDEILKVMKSLKNLKGGEKAILEFQTMISTAEFNEAQKQIERKLKELQEKISSSKTAKEFYDKILSATGDVDIAANVTMSIYGDTGEGLFEQTIAQIREVFKSGVEGVDIPIDLAFDLENQRIDYGKLAQIYEQYQDKMIEANRDTAQKIISEGQKTAAQNILTWEKELAKAKDYEQQRTDIIKQETERRANIIKSNLPEEEKQRQISLSYDLQAQKLADLDVKEFKGSEDFIKMFEDLDNQATSALKRMRDEIQKVIDTDKDMSPENMKTMVDALQKINDELQDRNPFGDMINGAKGMFDAIQQLKTATDELRQARAEYDAALPSLDADIDTAQKEKDSADEEVVARENELLAIRQQMAELDENDIITQTFLNDLKEQELQAQNNLVSAQLRQNQAQTQLVQAVNAKNKAEEKVTKAQKKTTDAQSKAKKEQNKFVKGVKKAGQAIETTKAVLEGLEPILGDLTSEATTMGDVFTAMVNTVQTFTAIMELVIILQEAFNIASESNPWIALAAAILAVTAALAGFISAQKVKKANQIIEEQQKILDQLEYTYGRLQNAADKLFGTDYIQNYNQQIKNLQATAEAYRKQMEAEQSKGKKADEDKIKEYKKNYIETLDEIADRQKELADHFLGTDQASAARDFAQAWLEAKVSFENTADAIKDKYKDLIQNMIIEGAAARVIDNILAQLWNAFNATLEKGDVNKAIEDLISGMDTFTAQADNAMNTLYQSLLAKGYDLQQILGEGDTDLTGIARDIATASEESINGLAQGINTQNYYISHVPTISENVAAIRILMEGGAVAQVGGDLVGMQNEHLAQLPIIAANTLATAERCERAAVACEAMQTAIERIIVAKGGNFVLNTRLMN